MSSCIFCQILAGKAPASMVFEDDLVVALLDIQPVNPGHTLVIPRVHAERLGEVPEQTLGRMISVAERVSRAFRAAGLACQGVNLFLADGDVAGQDVPHVHLHVFPRVRGDGFGLRFGTQYEVRPPRETLDEIASALRQALVRG